MHLSQTIFRAAPVLFLAFSLAGCRQSQRTEVVLSGGQTLTNRLQMQAGDAFVFKFPSGDRVAVWCERPHSFLGAAQPTDSRSGLVTVWGEVPFRKPKEILVKAGTNGHYAVAGWKSYIIPSIVTVSGSIERRYELRAGSQYFLIIEDLQATNCLPVTIITGRY